MNECVMSIDIINIFRKKNEINYFLTTFNIFRC